MKTSDGLKKVHDALKGHWIQEAWFTISGCMCIDGGLRMVAFGDAFREETDTSNAPEAKDLYSNMSRYVANGIDEMYPAWNAENYKGDNPRWNNIYFNDDPRHTEKDVLEVVLKAAELAERDEKHIPQEHTA